MKPVMKARFLRGEGGFTLIEMLITLTIWIAVLFTLYSVFDQSVRIYMVGNNKVEAAESARLGLEKMEREIRAAYPVDASADPANRFLFFSANGASPPTAAVMPANPSSQITFGNELGAEGAGDGKILCGTPCEYITYKLTDDANGSNAPCTVSPCDLRRVNTATSTDAGQPVVDNAVVPGGLTFTYLRSDGTTLATSEGQIAQVRVSLVITVDPGTQNAATQRLTTEIDLRNR
jgi:prepilin-type N-terminal cleavage/methylation domain-containing protein